MWYLNRVDTYGRKWSHMLKPTHDYSQFIAQISQIVNRNEVRVLWIQSQHRRVSIDSVSLRHLSLDNDEEVVVEQLGPEFAPDPSTKSQNHNHDQEESSISKIQQTVDTSAAQRYDGGATPTDSLVYSWSHLFD